MLTIEEIRQKNLRLLISNECGGRQTELANRIHTDKNSVSRWLAPSEKSSSRPMSSDTARSIEEVFGLPKGWMDIIQISTDNELFKLLGDALDQNPSAVKAFLKILPQVSKD